jgi:23S rRNA (adenine2503-C2)-methyltransferase
VTKDPKILLLVLASRSTPWLNHHHPSSIIHHPFSLASVIDHQSIFYKCLPASQPASDHKSHPAHTHQPTKTTRKQQKPSIAYVHVRSKMKHSEKLTTYVLLVAALSGCCSSWTTISRNLGFRAQTLPRRQNKLMSTKIPLEDLIPASLNDNRAAPSPLSYTLEDLAWTLGGKGRAQSCWDCFRLGVDPIWFFGNTSETENVGILDDNDDKLSAGWTRQQIQESDLFDQRRIDNGLGWRSVKLLKRRFGAIEDSIASLSKISTSPDGTTKLLLQLKQDGLEIETVIIPWDDRKKSTLCVSSQVGCRQACTFCSTGRMGKLRSLSSDEILAQMYWANKICRLKTIYPIDNVVYMGMGEPADNCEAVVPSAQRMVDRNLFRLAPRRVTISTVAPSPECFQELAEANSVLAWSVHATRDELRRELVPTTRHSMEELRDALSQVLQGRSKRLRNIMLEITLLDGINDSEEDALHLVEFCQPLLDEVKGIKLVVNLIPWNDIGATFGAASTYRSPTTARVLKFQKAVVDNGLLCYVRTTRGDEEQAACGMLATSKKASDYSKHQP